MMINVKNRLQGIILDWAGTTIDFGSRAPAAVFVEIFRRYGIAITVEEARGPMGRAKRDHIAAILAMPRIAALWQLKHRRKPTDQDIQRIYDDFLPLQKETLSNHADVIPGVIEIIAECRQRGLKIGSTTGYTRELMDVVCPLAAANGYAPEVVLCAGETAAGRPAPWMIFRAAEQLGVYPMSTVVVVDDTTVGIEAGRNAGAWTVGVTRTGNEFGFSLEEFKSLGDDEIRQLEQAATAKLTAAGSHFVIDSVASLLPVLDEINSRLSQGIGPDSATP